MMTNSHNSYCCDRPQNVSEDETYDFACAIQRNEDEMFDRELFLNTIYKELPKHHVKTADDDSTFGSLSNNIDLEVKKRTKLDLLWERLSKGNASQEKVYSGKHILDLPNKKIKEISEEDGHGFSGPEHGLSSIHKRINYRLVDQKEDVSQMPVSHKIKWNSRQNYAYGMITSLYEYDKEAQLTIGDPIADCFCAITKENCSIMALADGVSWGEKSKLAANCSIYGCMTYLVEHLDKTMLCTRDIFRCILRSFEQAQKCIVDEEAAMTTLCVAVVVELPEKPYWGLCVVNVGDTYAYVYSVKSGVREVTAGSHSIDAARDMRFAGGALGPADGYNPDLSNLTCSFTHIVEGDIVFLCSDGVSDNFDPVVAKFLPRFKMRSRCDSIIRRASLDPALLGHSDSQSNGSPTDSGVEDELECPPDISIDEHASEETVLNNHFEEEDNNECETDLPSNELNYSPNNASICLPNNESNCSPNNESNCSPNSNLNCLCEGEDEFYIKTDHFDNCDYVKCCMCQCASDKTSDKSDDEAMDDKVQREFQKRSQAFWHVLTPRERQEGALEQMAEVICSNDHEPIAGPSATAVDVCARLLNFVVNRTAEKRQLLEKVPQTELKKLPVAQRKRYMEELKAQLEEIPGKLDHASIVAYEVGIRKSPSMKLQRIANSSERLPAFTCEVNNKSDIPECVTEDWSTKASRKQELDEISLLAVRRASTHGSMGQIDSRKYFFYK